MPFYQLVSRLLISKNTRIRLFMGSGCSLHINCHGIDNLYHSLENSFPIILERDSMPLHQEYHFPTLVNSLAYALKAKRAKISETMPFTSWENAPFQNNSPFAKQVKCNIERFLRDNLRIEYKTLKENPCYL